MGARYIKLVLSTSSLRIYVNAVRVYFYLNLHCRDRLLYPVFTMLNFIGLHYLEAVLFTYEVNTRPKSSGRILF